MTPKVQDDRLGSLPIRIPCIVETKKKGFGECQNGRDKKQPEAAHG